MTTGNLAAAVVHAAPRATLQYLCRELVLADKQTQGYNHRGLWDKSEWWTAYWERLADWHYAWVRRRFPSLQVCPVCGRMHENQPGYLTCFACGAHWVSVSRV
jgi:hypothetical protein